MNFTYKKGIGIALIALIGFSSVVVALVWNSNIQPTLNVMTVLNDPSALELNSMSISERHEDYITWKIDLLIHNEGSQKLIFPALNFDVDFLGGSLGSGWIPSAVEIGPHSQKVIPAYIKMDRGLRLDIMVNGLLQGSAMELTLDGDAIVLIDAFSNSVPMASLAVPFQLPMALSEGDEPKPPKFYWINQSEVIKDTDVDINASATDSGGGLTTAILFYSNNSGSTWHNSSMSGLPAPVNMTESNWLNISLSATIPAPINVDGANISYYIHLIDDFGNEKLSDTYTYVVPSVSSISESQVSFEYPSSVDFLGNFLDYLASSGIDLNYLLRTITNETGNIAVLANIGAYFQAAAFEIYQAVNFLNQFLQNQTYAFALLSDARLSIYSLLEALTADMGMFLDTLIAQIALPTSDNLTELAINMDSNQKEVLNNTLISKFGYTNCSDLRNFTRYEFLDLLDEQICGLTFSAGDPILTGFLKLLQEGNVENAGFAAALQYWYSRGGTYEEFLDVLNAQSLTIPTATPGGTIQLYQSVMFGIFIYIGLGMVSIAALKGKSEVSGAEQLDKMKAENAKKTKKLTKNVDSWFKKSTVRS